MMSLTEESHVQPTADYRSNAQATLDLMFQTDPDVRKAAELLAKSNVKLGFGDTFHLQIWDGRRMVAPALVVLTPEGFRTAWNVACSSDLRGDNSEITLMPVEDDHSDLGQFSLRTIPARVREFLTDGSPDGWLIY